MKIFCVRGKPTGYIQPTLPRSPWKKLEEHEDNYHRAAENIQILSVTDIVVSQFSSSQPLDRTVSFVLLAFLALPLILRRLGISQECILCVKYSVPLSEWHFEALY